MNFHFSDLDFLTRYLWWLAPCFFSSKNRSKNCFSKFFYNTLKNIIHFRQHNLSDLNTNSYTFFKEYCIFFYLLANFKFKLYLVNSKIVQIIFIFVWFIRLTKSLIDKMVRYTLVHLRTNDYSLTFTPLLDSKLLQCICHLHKLNAIQNIFWSKSWKFLLIKLFYHR